MSRRFYNLILLATVLTVPLLAGLWWWNYWPIYQHRQDLIRIERALKEDNLSKADEIIHNLLNDNPKDLQALFLYAQVLRKSGRNAEAWNTLHQAIQAGLPESEGLR